MRFQLLSLIACGSLVIYTACGSGDEKTRVRGEDAGEGGESGGGGGAAGAGAQQSDGGVGGEAGAAIRGGAPSSGGAGGVGGSGAASGEGGNGGVEVQGGAAGAMAQGGASGDTAVGGAGGEGGAAPVRTTKFVFVSSVAYTGNLGGLDGADAKCAALALAADLPGTYKAWLSDATGSPSTRFTHPTVDYVLSDGVTVFANGWSDLGQNNHALDMNELGGPPPVSDTACAGLNGGYAAWVSTNGDGTPAPGVAAGDHSCSNWSSEAVETTTVGLGSPVAANSWIGFCSSGNPTCGKSAAIFCFEQ